MKHTKRIFLLINVLGGVAVLGSYAWGLATRADAGSLLWGGVPQAIRPLYTVCMLLAAGGYFLFTPLIAYRLNPETTRLFGRYGYAAFNWLYATILIPSALWLPLTFLAADNPGVGLTWLVRLDLALVALGSLEVLGALLTLQPRPGLWVRRLAVFGCILFCLQTVVLDAIVWSVYWRG